MSARASGDGMVTAFSKCRHQKHKKNQRGDGMTGSDGIPLYLRARARTHTIQNACHACHAVTALKNKGFSVTASKICRHCLTPMEVVACS